MKTYEQLLLANKAWAQEVTEQDPQFFSRQAAGERPEIFWIGASDSRVSPEQLTQSLPGEILLHRNIANLVETDDLNFMSALQYAVEYLRVGHIILCGNYGCGGIKAVLRGDATGPMGDWLRKIRDVQTNYADEIAAQPEGEAREDRMVELNVCAQLLDIANTDIVQKAFADPNHDLQLHGWVYDLRNGHLKPMLEIDATTDLGALNPAHESPEADAPAQQKMPEGL